jgi:hypothetical protein
MKPLYIQGMHGLGDSVHERAVVRALNADGYSVWLEASWPSVFHDLVGPNLHLVGKNMPLRTCSINAARERDKLQRDITIQLPPRTPVLKMMYQGRQVGDGPILKAMFDVAGVGHRYAEADYRLPVPQEWYGLLPDCLKFHDKPLLVYRPLTARPEGRGGSLRNANVDDYAEVFAAIRDDYTVVSLSFLDPKEEWIVGPRLRADFTFNHGELVFEQIAALFSRAAMVYTSSGMGAVLAPAVGTPCISIQGGYEPASWHQDGAKFAPFLGINPIKPCICASSSCSRNCKKNLDTPAAIAAVREFCGLSANAETRSVSEMFDPALPTPMLTKPFRPWGGAIRA